MTATGGPQGHSGEEAGRTFVPPEDRPEPRITLDTPLSELRVRDLEAILGITPYPKPILDNPPPKVPPKFEKSEVIDKYAIDYPGISIDLFRPHLPGPDPGPYRGIDQVVDAVARLTRQVSELADQIGELRRR